MGITYGIVLEKIVKIGMATRKRFTCSENSFC